MIMIGRTIHRRGYKFLFTERRELCLAMAHLTNTTTKAIRTPLLFRINHNLNVINQKTFEKVHPEMSLDKTWISLVESFHRKDRGMRIDTLLVINMIVTGPMILQHPDVVNEGVEVEAERDMTMIEKEVQITEDDPMIDTVR
jgi:hypothetical protein